MFYYYDFTYLLYMIPAMLFALWAQLKVSSSFKKAERVASPRNMSGAECARMVLDRNGVSGVEIRRVSGNLTDHYDPRNNTIFLSESVYDSRTCAAIGVAAHEAGHAVQHAQGYTPIKIRMAMVPAVNFGARFSWLFLMLGIFLSMTSLCYVGIALFALSTLFHLVTLPVELNASRRAISTIEESGAPKENVRAAHSVLSAAALTYLAALASSILQLLYYLSRVRRTRD